MEVTHTETNRGNSAIIVDGYIYHKMNVLKSGDVVYQLFSVEVCSADRIKVDGLLDMSPDAFRTRTRRTWASDFHSSDSMLQVWSSNKLENFVISNDRDSGIIIFSTLTSSKLTVYVQSNG
jgi:hypothetical protein